MKQLTLLALASVLCLRASAATSSAQLADALRLLRAVGPEGQGNAAASAAWKDLSAADPKALPTILAGMDGANEFAVNWLRAAVEAIAARELAAGRSLPIAALEKFIQDTGHHPRARRLAYELVERTDGPAARRMLAGMLNDPSSELRRDAVQLVIEKATGLRAAGQTNEAVPQYRTALQSARDIDQVEDLAKKLKELGAPVELPAVFGWISTWKVVGPFDSTGGAGFEKVYPPESGIDLKAEYDGKNGKVRWQEGRARGDYGLVDFNAPLGKLKAVAGYAYTEFSVDRSRPAELRLGCKNAWKIWLNGQFIFGRDEYHRGIEIDQYQLKVDLKPGRNTLLVKLCQNEQVEDWTVEWEFQLRITDSLGTPIPLAKTE